MPAPEPAGKSSGSRILYIDNLRILLICLVIVTHTSITYGGPGGWYYTDPGNAEISPFILEVIDALNQAFFMGSLHRKGTSRFIHDRLVRLGIPLVIWILLINPFIVLIIKMGTGTIPTDKGNLLDPVFGPGLGPMWFVAFLLMATFAYLAWIKVRQQDRPATGERRPFPGFASILALGILLGAITAAVRIFFPIGSIWLFGFQLPFFPQYIAAFIIGIYAAENRWLDEIPDRVGKACTAASIFLVALLLFITLLFADSAGWLSFVRGGVHWQAVVFAFWEQMAGVMIVVALLWIFSLHLNRQGSVSQAMAGDSYTVYIIHPVVLVSLALAFAGIALPQLLKFSIVLSLVIVISFALAHVIRTLPGAKKVL
jgi:peptidoglycan/LPS O-acetylase OafA/YrhL